jgi:hypothetical protein
MHLLSAVQDGGVCLQGEYDFDYDIWFEKPLKKERTSIQKPLVEFLKKETEERHARVRTPSKYAVLMKSRGMQFGILAGEFIHTGFNLRTPSARDINFANDLLGKLTGYFPTLVGHPVKLVNLGISMDCKVNKSVVPTFVDLRNLADLGLKIKMDIKPMTVGFQSKTKDMEFWAALTEHRKEYSLNTYLEREAKGESMWNFVRKSYEDVNILTARISRALGVRILHG